MKWFAFGWLTVVVAIGSLGWAQGPSENSVSPGISESAQSAEFSEYLRKGRDPAKAAKIEAYLKAYPKDVDMREQALRFYSFNGNSVARLKYHTLQMVEYHPDNWAIQAHCVEMLVHDKPFLEQILKRLKQKASTGKGNPGAYNAMGEICVAVGLPPRMSTGPGGTMVPSIDLILVGRGIGYYRRAIAMSAPGSPVQTEAYHGLATALMDLNRPSEALTAYEKCLPGIQSSLRASTMIEYGECLRALKRPAAAKVVFFQVLESVYKEPWPTPNWDTIKAYDNLGMMALESGNVREACGYFMVATGRTPNRMNSFRIPPLKLTYRLIEIGQYDLVISYCEGVAKSDVGSTPLVDQFLSQAQTAKAKAEGAK